MEKENDKDNDKEEKMDLNKENLIKYFTNLNINFKNNYDSLTLYLHLCLLVTDFECIGINEKDTEQKLEIIPNGWNNDESSYSFKYKSKNQTINMKTIPIGKVLMISCYEEGKEEENIITYEIKVNDYINKNEELSNLSKYFINLEKLYSNIYENIIKRLNKTKTNVKKIEKMEYEDDDEDILRIGPKRRSKIGENDLYPNLGKTFFFLIKKYEKEVEVKWDQKMSFLNNI
jgi:hypothetical protein